jgi:hypothetical protein
MEQQGVRPSPCPLPMHRPVGVLVAGGMLGITEATLPIDCECRAFHRVVPADAVG